MDPVFLQLLIFGLAAAAANVLGGLLLFPSKLHSTYKRFLKYLLAIGAGFMLSVTIIEILPKSVLIWQRDFPQDSEDLYVPMLLIIGGYLLTQFFEHTIAPHFHLGEEMGSGEILSRSTAYTAVGGLLIHSLFDGISIAAAAQIDSKLGLLVFVAVLLHKFPEGFTIGSMVLASGNGLRSVVTATGMLGVTTLVGVIAFYFIGANVNSAVAYALPVSGGVTLYVAASDLIPEVNHHGGHKPGVSISVFAGVALFFGIHFFLHRAFGH